jgi:pyruvate-formate lyase-activating enzyme
MRLLWMLFAIPLLERHRKKGFAGIVVLNGHTTREYVQQRAKNAENVPK